LQRPRWDTQAIIISATATFKVGPQRCAAVSGGDIFVSWTSRELAVANATHASNARRSLAPASTLATMFASCLRTPAANTAAQRCAAGVSGSNTAAVLAWHAHMRSAETNAARAGASRLDRRASAPKLEQALLEMLALKRENKHRFLVLWTHLWFVDDDLLGCMAATAAASGTMHSCVAK
jgi:hypothetical protein